MKNYLEHEEQVKYVEAYLNRQTEWQWFIEIIENSFQINEITSWVEFINQKHIVSRVLSYFIKVSECNRNELNFSNTFIEEIYLISEFYNGLKDRNLVYEKLNTNISKVLLLVTWITLIENKTSNRSYLMDVSLLTQRNMFLLIEMAEFSLYENEITDLMNSIEMDDIENIKETFIDNVNAIEYAPNYEFLEKHRDTIINANAFNFTMIEDKPSNLSWEENFLLDMLEISFQDRKIVPLVSSVGSSRPDVSLWKKDLLDELKTFFHKDLADFVIETVEYVLFERVPSQGVIDRHIDLLIEQIQNKEETYDKFMCSSFEIISYLYEDNKMNSSKKKDLMIIFQGITDINELKILQEKNIPLSKDQKKTLKIHFDQSYLKIGEITNYRLFSNYLKNPDVAKTINNDYFRIVANAFDKYVKEADSSIICSNIFLNYMLFLLALKKNINIDQNFISFEMIRVQKLWENTYYEICCGKLQSFSHEAEVKKEIIDEFNEKVLNNVFILASNCMITKLDGYLNVMELVSCNPLLHMVSIVHISKSYPVDDKHSFTLERHDIDSFTDNIVEKIKDKYGYKFVNKMETELYVKEIHERMKLNALITFQLFHNVEGLYLIVEDELRNEYKLIGYEDDLNLAHLSQLFPIVEIKIKELGIRYNVVPFKEDEKHFMQSKDPSSILREILELSYRETDGFEVVPDILMAYHFLYNGNSLNIRNECVHGRDYLKGERLTFALKVTLSVLLMIIKRIELIDENLNKKKANS